MVDNAKGHFGAAAFEFPPYPYSELARADFLRSIQRRANGVPKTSCNSTLKRA